MNEHVMADEQAAGARAATAPVLYLNAVQRRYQQGEAELTILRGAELGCWLGQSIALIAPSGAGKSTLLHIAGLLEHPDGGEVYVDGRPTANTLMVKILDEIYVCCWFHRREGSARPPALVGRGSAQVGDDRDGPQPD